MRIKFPFLDAASSTLQTWWTSQGRVAGMHSKCEQLRHVAGGYMSTDPYRAPKRTAPRQIWRNVEANFNLLLLVRKGGLGGYKYSLMLHDVD